MSAAQPWPETWMEAARAMRLEGRSARQIADALNAKFGAGLTRSAVLCKLCRMGVAASAKPAKWPPAPRTPPAQETDAPPSATVGIDILALTRSVCCWPIDPAGARGWRYCGAPVDARELAERGQDIPPLMLLIDVTAGRVTHLGWEARLAPMECALLMALLRCAPQIVSYDRLLLSLYPGGEEPDWAASHLKVLVFRLRRKLKPMGLSIANSRSEGYALRADPEVIHAARRFAARRRAG